MQTESKETIEDILGFEEEMDDYMANVAKEEVGAKPLEPIKTLADLVRDFVSKIKTHDLGSIIKTGFPNFDRRYLGIAPQELWIIGGYTGTGKSFFLLQLFLNILRQGKRATFFSLEMGTGALTARLLANISGIDSMQLEWGNLTQNQLLDRQKAQDELEKLGTKAVLRDDLYQLPQIEAAIAETKPDVVFIDYLQNIQDDRDEYQKLTAVSSKLQEIAKKYNCAIVGASQLSNEFAKDSNSRVIGFKGSGSIAAACDFGIVLEGEVQQVIDTEKQIKLVVRKSRRGAQKLYEMKLKFPSGRYEEVLSE